MIIAAPEPDLLIRADTHGLIHAPRDTEVEGRARDRPDLASGDKACVDRCVGFGGYGQQMTKGTTRRPLPRQIEDSVIGEVNDGRLARRRLETDGEPAAFIERVADAGIERAGITRLAIRTAVGEDDLGPWSAADGHDLPQLLVKPLAPAVERIALVIERQLIGLAIHGELAPADAVGIAADRAAEEIRPREIIGKLVIAEQHIGLPAITIGAGQRLQCRAIGQDASRNALPTGKCDRFDRPAVRKMACSGATGLGRMC